ncbi:MAG: branched-chain amino acid ABC transporter permease [Bdellovibrionales bacterium]
MKKAFQRPALIFLGFLVSGFVFQHALNGYIQILILQILMYSIAAMSLNLVNGFTGQFSLGHAGFMAVGAYTSAYLSQLFPGFLESTHILGFLIFSILSGVTAGLCGYAVGLPSLRLRGDYLAIVTLGFGEILRVILLNVEALGAARGISGIVPYPELGFLDRFWVSFSYISFWFLVCFFFLWRLTRGRFGRQFLSVREDEVAALSLGLNTTSIKVNSFVVASFFAGVTGSIYAHLISIVTPSVFGFMMSVNIVVMVVLGGMGSFSGSILAATFMTLVPELLRSLQTFTGIDLRMVLFSFSLILIMIFRPSGLMGEKEMTDYFDLSRFKKGTKA